MKFSGQTLRFLEKAARQRHPTWLDRNREEYEAVVQEPITALAKHLKSTLAPIAPGYHFPQKGLARMRRSAMYAEEYGGLYKGWVSYSASVPSGSRFDHNPNLYFVIQPEDKEDPVLVAGGLYMPSSRQLRAIREAIATDASAFDQLFATRDFKRCFKGGFSHDRKSSRPPRGFDPAHPRMDWLKLQAFFVWRPYTMKEFKSEGFAKLVERDWRQILRLNELLTGAIQGRALARIAPATRSRGSASLLDRLGELDPAPSTARVMDF